MVQLIVDNSYSRITGLSPDHFKSLSEDLSYTVGGSSAYFSKYGARRRSFLSKRGEFPTGLLSDVADFLSESNVKPIVKDLRIVPTKRLKISSNWTGVIPYEDQVAAVATAVAAHRGIISMPTGTGKSLVIAMIASELRVRTLVVVPTLEIKKQLTEGLQERFSDMSWITVENIDSSSLKTAKDYDCLIIDEAHHSAAKTYRKLNKNVWNKIYYRFFLTATPFRNDPEEELLFNSIAGDIIYKLSYKDAIRKGYIVPVEAYYIELPKIVTKSVTYREVYSELVVNNDYRNVQIVSLIHSLGAKYLLCLVKEIAHGLELSLPTGIPFVCGEDENSRYFIQEFNEAKRLALIGTTGILGEGVDTKPCEVVIIAGLGKAKSQFLQQVGRAVRKYPGKESAKVIIFKDPSHKYLLRHFKEQCKILKEEYGVEPIKLEV